MAKRSVAPRMIVGYVRVSTSEQAQAGFSIDAQRARIELFAQVSRDFHPVDAYLVDDGFSGSNLERPAMMELLGKIKRREVAAVYVTKLDRLSRNLRDILELLDLCQQTNTALLSASESLDTSSAVGRMVVHLLGTFAEFERGRISERTSDVLGFRRRSGKRYSKFPPFGYAYENDALVAVPDELEALAEMQTMRASGHTYRAIAEMLDARGVRPHRATKWTAGSISAVLNSKMAQEGSNA